MRCLLIAVMLLLPISSSAFTFSKEVKECVKSIEVIEGDSARPYTFISPVRAKKGKGITGLFTGKSAIDRAFASIKEDACEKGADAIIKFQCNEAITGSGSVHGDANGVDGSSSVGTVPVCVGTAVKWK